jgi:S-DNA-T family DNA segregation ATPase FtsK/SpoIIIE
MNGGGGDDDGDSDELIPAAKDEILRAGKASASLLQRRLKVGYARAARLLDLLEQEGFIGPADGAKPRDILKADLGSDEPIPEIPSPNDTESV